MAVDHYLVHQLMGRAEMRAQAYRCEFIEAVKAGAGGHKLALHAQDFRALPRWSAVGLDVKLSHVSKARGVVYAWCEHDDQMGWQMGNEISGEFEAR